MAGNTPATGAPATGTSESAGAPSTGAPSTGTSGSTSAPATGTEQSNWYGGYDADTVTYVEGKHWKEPKDAVQSYRNLEKLMSADRAGRTVALPGDNAAPEEVSAFYEKLGRPASPDKYSFKTEGDDGGFADWAKNTFHVTGVTDKQAGTLVEAFGKFTAEARQRNASERAANAAKEHDELKKTWGGAYDHKVQLAKRAAARFGLNDDQVTNLENAIGFSGIMQFMAEVGAKMGEAEFHKDGDNVGFGPLDPAEARKELGRLMHDKEFVEQWTNKTHPKHKEAVERKSRLVALAS